MGGLTNLTQNYLMGKQRRQEADEAKNQNQLMMGLMSGQQLSPEQVSSMDPQKYMMGQQYVRQQQDRTSQQQAAQQQAADVLDDERDKKDIMGMLSTDYAGQTAILQNRLNEITEGGGNPADTQMLLDMPEEQRAKYLPMMAEQAGIKIGGTDQTDIVSDLIAAGMQPGSEEFKAAILDKHGKGKTIGYDIKEAINPETGKREYVQVSRTSGGVSEWLGLEVPVDAKVEADLIKTSEKEKDKAESEIRTIEGTLNTLGKILSSEGLSGFSGWDQLRSMNPGSDAANVKAWIEQLQSQNFLTAVDQMKGMGALSENEGKKLAGSVAALDSSMSDEAIKAELEYIQSTLKEAAEKIKAGNLATTDDEVTEWGDLK